MVDALDKKTEVAKKGFEYIVSEELKAIAARRKNMMMPPPEDDLVGIALSGGGIRSATLCLGVLETFKKFCLLQKADYLSSVSGGGYIAGYVHATLRNNGSDPKAYDSLFSKDDVDRLHRYDTYLTPRAGLGKAFNFFRLIGAYVYSFFMNLVWVLSLFVCIGALTNWMYHLLDANLYGGILLSGAIIVFGVHFLLHPLRPYLWSSRILYIAEGIIIILALPFAVHQLYTAYADAGGVFARILSACICFDWLGGTLETSLRGNGFWPTIPVFFGIFTVTGFFANPNLLTFHRFYRDSLAEAYLSLIRGVDRAFKLWDLNPGQGADAWGAAPYPLINTCLNLLGRNDPSFAGTGSCEHFLLSPLFCGSKLTGYIRSRGDAYHVMTLATAMATSGAAVNPGMGYKSNRFLAFIMTILNMRLGYWAPNPASPLRRLWTWWPWYHITEMLALSNSKRQRISLSDGGQVENLGVFELLRRRCRLIIAIDASADAEYGFDDLKELVIQAHNILGVTITFRNSPEDVIRPDPSFGYSKEHFAIADIGVLPGIEGELAGYEGILVYLKSSLMAQQNWKKDVTKSYAYKTYHPAFPHESTSDQFFDDAQWEAYRTLGQQMADELLCKVLGKKPAAPALCAMGFNELYKVFEGYGG
jgi:hypothetical protein